MYSLLLKTQFLSCLFMVGVIWTIQLVHYPSFHFVASENFVSFEKFHAFRISLVVIPAMLIELLTAAALVYFFKENSQLLMINFILVLCIWAVTFFISSPAHGKLLSGFSTETINFLISTNWIRTILWTAKAALIFYIL